MWSTLLGRFGGGHTAAATAAADGAGTHYGTTKVSGTGTSAVTGTVSRLARGADSATIPRPWGNVASHSPIPHQHSTVHTTGHTTSKSHRRPLGAPLGTQPIIRNPATDSNASAVCSPPTTSSISADLINKLDHAIQGEHEPHARPTDNHHHHHHLYDLASNSNNTSGQESLYPDDCYIHPAIRGEPRGPTTLPRASAVVLTPALQHPLRGKLSALSLAASSQTSTTSGDAPSVPLPITLKKAGPRLWNPVNFTPRGVYPSTNYADTASVAKPLPVYRRRRSSSPPPPVIPLRLASPTFGDIFVNYDAPLLSTSVEEKAIDNSRSCLPPGVRFSVDSRISQNSLRISRTRESYQSVFNGPVSSCHSFNSGNTGVSPLQRPSGIAERTVGAGGVSRADHSKEAQPPTSAKARGKMPTGPSDQVTSETVNPGIYSPDLEGGNVYTSHADASQLGGLDGFTDSDESSILGDPDDPQVDEDSWGPSHPCYPHLNPHVPVDSPEYASTRVIRIKRDWLVAGDLAPTFSNIYPEILESANLSDQAFRRIIDKLNTDLTKAFNPSGKRNILDAIIGLFTGWLWDDFGMTAVKSRLAKIEKWIQAWNEEARRQAGEDAHLAPQIIPLRKTGYMSLDMQIPDPEVVIEPPTPAALPSQQPASGGLDHKTTPAGVLS